MAFVAALYGAHMGEFASRRFARTALIPPADRLTLVFICPVFGEVGGLRLLCLFKRLILCAKFLPWRLIQEKLEFPLALAFALEQLFKCGRKARLGWSPLQKAGDVTAHGGHFVEGFIEGPAFRSLIVFHILRSAESSS